MKETIKAIDKTGGKHNLQFFMEAYTDYIALSRYLFGKKTPIYNINEMKVDNKFYDKAQKIAKQLKICWKTMTHEESNRIMLALLEDAYVAMESVADRKKLAIEIELKILK